MQPVRVSGIKCPCPGTPHPAGDWVDLHPHATIAIGAAVSMAISLHGNAPVTMQGALMEAEVLNGIVAWSFVTTDAKGERVPVPVATGFPGWGDTVNELLPFGGGGYQVAQKADELYSEEVLNPLVAALKKPSQDGQPENTTSLPPPSGEKHQKRPKRSSRGSSDGMPSAALAN